MRSKHSPSGRAGGGGGGEGTDGAVPVATVRGRPRRKVQHNRLWVWTAGGRELEKEGREGHSGGGTDHAARGKAQRQEGAFEEA